MKPVRRVESTSQSCSCTSCLYKSESEQPSIRKYVVHGSRIDRLYFGKYIPLRERKLLNRLVRTRAVYDDLRARLISDSTLSLDKKADLRPGKHHRVKTLDSNKSGAILELVDIIDKGAALGPEKLSDCCSCCSCSSQSNILKVNKKEKRQKGIKPRIYEEEYGITGQTGTGEGVYARTHKKKYVKTGHTGTGEGEYAIYEREFGKKVSGRAGHRYKKGGVRFKPKQVRSDPCTCTLKFSGLITKHSKAMFRKIRPLPLGEPTLDAAEYQWIVEKSQKKKRKSLQKFMDIRNKLEQDLKKLNESTVNVKQNLQLRAKKSLEKVKQAKNAIKTNIGSGVRKSIQVIKNLHPKETFEVVEYPEDVTAFNIKKDSIVKFKDHLKRKEMLKDWECDLECEPEICVPEECFKILKLKRLRKRSPKPELKRAVGYEIVKREVKVGGTPLNRSSSGVQADGTAINTATYIKKHKPVLRVDSRNQIKEQRLIFESEREYKGTNKGLKRYVNKSSVIPASFKAFHDNKEKGHTDGTKNEILKERGLIVKKPPSRGRQAVRLTSSFSFDIEFYKNRPEGMSYPSSKSSGIYLHAPKGRRRIHRHHKSIAMSKSSFEFSQGTSETQKTKLIQTDRYGKPLTMTRQAVKRLSNVQTNTNYGTKSVSSTTNTAAKMDKNVSKEVKQKGRLSQASILSPSHVDIMTSEVKESSPHKQAVRIGSTFSFNIEFYKNDEKNSSKTVNSPYRLKSSKSIIRKEKHTRDRHAQVKHRIVQVKGTSARAYNQAKNTLHRCFCTLKLKKHVKTKKETKEKVPLPIMIDKRVETNINFNRYEPSKRYDLLPYECEPGICIPGECDPLLCKQLLDLRNQGFRRKNRSIGSYTGSRQTKSTSSLVSRPFNSSRPKFVQSSTVPTKIGSTGVPRRYKNNFDLGRNNFLKSTINSSERQAVRIGSSFSFSIEFYKNKQNPGVAIVNKPIFNSMLPEIKNKEKKFQYPRKYNNKRNKSMFTRVMKMDKYIGPSLKDCECTLKSYKNRIQKKKTKKPYANTQTFGESPIQVLVNRGTRTQKVPQYKLLPYECEPYTCVPGECDPYICLQNIKRRELNTRDNSAFTDKLDTSSTSSLTENSLKKSEALLVQPKLFPKGTKMKANYLKNLYGKPKSKRENLNMATKSKQAVRVGSSFNFSIEFSKQSPGPLTLTNDPKIKQSSNVYQKINKDKGITLTKVRVDHGDTQVQKPKKNNKALLARPMLKRCFCSLNLQKNTKQQYHKHKHDIEYFGPKVYTVGRATTTKTEIFSSNFGSQIKAKLLLTKPKTKLISISASSFLLNKYVKNLQSSYEAVELYSALSIPIESKDPVFIKSNLSMNLNIIRQVFPSEESWTRFIKEPLKTFRPALINRKSCEYFNLFNQASKQNKKKKISINQYFEQCFCTMNVQISNPGKITSIKKISHKLKPNECEPGVCIPDECDPYECKKRIMKRLAKNIDQASGTRSKSISRYSTSNTRLVSKNTQMLTHLRSHSQETDPQKYKLQRQREATHRQTVRIKSSFSFDLEFYKHRSQPFEKNVNQDVISRSIKKPVNQKSKQGVGVGIQENKIQGKEINIQSSVTSLHKRTGTKTKRCFCTLKLHKKGRIHKSHAKTNRIPSKQLPSVISRNVKIGTSAKKYKIPLDVNNLDVYECPPGICIPGQCDPYKCLELMRHRKNLGINTSQNETNTISSMTSEEKYKTRALDTAPLKRHHKSTKTVRYVNNILNGNEITHIADQTGKSAVRIGSSFSFNIEFFKDVPQELQHNKTNLQKRTTEGEEQVKNKRETKVNVSSSKKKNSDETTATEKSLNVEATSKSKLRSLKVQESGKKRNFKNRCLCVLGLLKKKNEGAENLKIHNKNKKSFMKSKEDKNNQLTEKQVNTAEKLTNTRLKSKILTRYLEPYECEPGICIPGECNPLECEKIIQRRLAKQRSKKLETDAIQTRSTSSIFGNNKQLKHESSQAQQQTDKRNTQHRSNNISYISKQPSHKDKRPVQIQQPHNDKASSILNDKRVVRIGSNFSFNIEFYKENANSNVITSNGEIKTYPNKQAQNTKLPSNTPQPPKSPKGKGTETVSVRCNKSQVKPKMKTSGASPLLKRCFCTLKLLKKQIDQNENLNKSNSKPITKTKTVETQSHRRLRSPALQHDFIRQNVSPYECEPFTCIPGQCDPVECLKRIQTRQQQTKESSTLTKNPKRKSIGSVSTRMKDENLQVKNIARHPHKSIKKTSHAENSLSEKCYQPRQAVRIGSNFSFNIEFFKDFDDDFTNVVNKRPAEESPIVTEKITRHHTTTEPSILRQSVDSQVKPTKLQTTETATENLKRCFCTLPLRKKHLMKQEKPSIKIQTNQPQSDQSSAGDFLKKCMCTFKLNKVGKQKTIFSAPAVKYQIKGTSTKSQRAAPRYNFQKLEPYECEPGTCIPGECDPYECLKRIQRRQVRDFGTHYKHNVKDAATESIKQPLTRSTKAQYYKRKLNSKGTCFGSKCTRRSKEITQNLQDPSLSTNRQVVRIGSNFSFNVEFFKDHGTANATHRYLQPETPSNFKLKRQRKPSTKSRGSISAIKRIRDKKSQYSSRKTQAAFSSINIPPKRCFCTLKLLNKPDHPKSDGKLISSNIPTKDKATVAKINYSIPHDLGVYECPPLMCIPGECNPYKCLEKIKKREKMGKHCNVGTRAARTSAASVGNRGLSLRTNKVQSQLAKRKNVSASTDHPEPQSEILKSTRNNEDRQNKRAVRIGSNFNFNVEFFKQNLQSTVAPVSEIVKRNNNCKDSIYNENKNFAVKSRNFGNSFGHKSKLKNQATDAGNSLKRCFCTLQFQNSNDKMKDKNNRPGNIVTYPQVLTIGRVAIEPCCHTVEKINQTKTVKKARSTYIDRKLFNRTVGTKTDKRYLNFSAAECNPSNCPNYQKRISKESTANDMKIILPFTPNKFGKESKTYLSTKKFKKSNDICLLSTYVNKPNDSSIGGKFGRRLTAKKSKKSIPTNSVDVKPTLRDSFFSRCVRYCTLKFKPATEGSDEQENMNDTKMKLVLPPKKAKSLGDDCPFICPKDEVTGKRNVNKSMKKSCNSSKINTHRSKNQGGGKFVTFADNSECPNKKKCKSINSKSKARSTLCYSCSVNDCPFNKSKQRTPGQIKIHVKGNNNYKKANSESVELCQYCPCCKEKIDPDEIRKGGGDRRSIISSQNKQDIESCPCDKKPIRKTKKRTLSLSDKSKVDEPLEMRIDHDSCTIINKSEVSKKINELYTKKKMVKVSSKIKSKHVDTCVCCKCLKKHKTQKADKSQNQKATTTPKPASELSSKFANLFSLVKKDINAPCICGSKKCATDSKKRRTGGKQQIKESKRCVCGSDICATETRNIERKRQIAIQEGKLKYDFIKNKKDRQKILQRVKKEEQIDQIRRALRIKRNKELEKRVHEFKDASDVTLAVDSLIDIGRLGVSSLGSALRYTTKAVVDPKVTCERICKKCRKKDPEALFKDFHKDYMDSDTAATMRRLKIRCKNMKNIQALKDKMESNRFTHFLLHMMDKNPKTRRFKPKPVRRIREPLDFQCSLYMASLRKRPYLSVYYRCPWFYPHFMSILNIWKQFTDIMLFLIAAVVWSPCILFMEGCRALMCCFFCTG